MTAAFTPRAGCYMCCHRRPVPGDHHSACIVGRADGAGGFLEAAMTRAGAKSPVTLDPHGVRMGWAFWPVNYDPAWVTGCTAFEAREPATADADTGGYSSS